MVRAGDTGTIPFRYCNGCRNDAHRYDMPSPKLTPVLVPGDGWKAEEALSPVGSMSLHQYLLPAARFELLKFSSQNLLWEIHHYPSSVRRLNLLEGRRSKDYLQPAIGGILFRLVALSILLRASESLLAKSWPKTLDCH